MPLEIVTVPCLADNYAYLLHAPLTGLTALVDAPEAAPIIAALEDRGWTLDFVLLTHHHWDHVDALPELREKYAPSVIGAEADRGRLPDLDMAVSPGTDFSLGNVSVKVFDVPGHTIGHIAYYIPSVHAAFTADSLMTLGCGRLFEGTPQQMMDSFAALGALPNNTLIYSGHEYAATNAKFALTVDPDNADLITRAEQIADARAKGEPTVPALLSDEKNTNPFFRAHTAGIRKALGIADASDLEVFTEVRLRRNQF